MSSSATSVVISHYVIISHQCRHQSVIVIISHQYRRQSVVIIVIISHQCRRQSVIIIVIIIIIYSCRHL